MTIRSHRREAETLLSQAYQRIVEYGKDCPGVRKGIVDDLIALYESWGKPTEVGRWRALASLS